MHEAGHDELGIGRMFGAQQRAALQGMREGIDVGLVEHLVTPAEEGEEIVDGCESGHPAIVARTPSRMWIAMSIWPRVMTSGGGEPHHGFARREHDEPAPERLLLHVHRLLVVGELDADHQAATPDGADQRDGDAAARRAASSGTRPCRRRAV